MFVVGAGGGGRAEDKDKFNFNPDNIDAAGVNVAIFFIKLIDINWQLKDLTSTIATSVKQLTRHIALFGTCFEVSCCTSISFGFGNRSVNLQPATKSNPQPDGEPESNVCNRFNICLCVPVK